MTATLIVLMFMSSAVTAIFFLIWLSSVLRLWPGIVWIQGETVSISFAILIAFMILIALREDRHFFKDWYFFGLGKFFK